MSVFNLDDNTLFIFSNDGYRLELRRLESRAMYSPSLVFAPKWEPLNTIDPGKGDTLNVFGTVIDGKRLQNMAAYLNKYKCSTNREGYLYCYLRSGSPYVQRQNEMFSWSSYGVVPKVTTVWNRCDMYSCKPVVDYQEKEKDLKDRKSKLEKAKKELSLFEQRLENKEEEFSSVSESFLDKENECYKLEKYIRDKGRDINGFEKRIQDKEKECSNLEKLLQEAEEECSRLEKLFQDEENKCSDLEKLLTEGQ